MKFPMFLAALLLPAIALAQQTVDKAKTVPGGDTAPLNYSVVLPADAYQYIPGNTFLADQEQSKVRVNLNLRNAPLKEAIKQLSAQTKEEFVLESDVPADARVTVVVKNIRLSTALDLLTDVTDLKWNQRVELKWDKQTAKKPATTGSTTTYHIGKNVMPNQQNTPWSVLLNKDNYRYFEDQQGNTFNFAKPLPNQNLKQYSPYETLPKKNDAPSGIDVTPLLKWSPQKDGNTSLTPNTPSHLDIRSSYSPTKPGDLVSRDIRSSYSPTKPGDLTALLSLSTTYQQGNNLVTSIDLKEVRSTFTCPNCKHQVTVIHKMEAPKCEKCGRVFHDDWQFCPFDGAKRPAAADADWQFCPICGKSIKPDGNGKAEAKTDGTNKPDAKPVKP